ncbi:MAG TPA: aminotransferase class V-fold PLP-dependent enzyme [Allosphingosinicella sp.]|nr:aminotransferase class V-fold PLP-dependent enzyme [Allosphingosinicella sp.]
MPLIPCQSALFDIAEGTAYLDCAKMSPLSRAAIEAGRRGLERKSRPWEVRAEHFFDESEAVRGLFAQLIGSSADDVAIIPSVSYGMATAMANIRVAAGQKIVTLADDFPSGILASRALAQRSEARVVTVARPAEGSWTAALVDSIDGDTALVVAPHTHWMCGTLIAVEALGRRCRSVGAALVLDTTQSTGALPLDLAAVDPDYLIATAYKWMMGPYSLGFLYVAPRHQQGRPLEEAWIVRRNAQDFRSLCDYDEAFAAGARRFDMGERANFALLPVAAEAIGQLLDWGVEDIAETLGSKTKAIEARLRERGIAGQEGRAPHFLSVRFPGGLPEGIEERLAAAGVHVSLRGERMRITPHLYNDESDEERLVEALWAR